MSQHAKDIAFPWPEQPFHICLVEPDIPQNAGNIARLCAATGTTLHLVKPLGFRLTDAKLKRAGLDYWDAVEVVVHENFGEFRAAFAGHRLLFLSAKVDRTYTTVKYRAGDVLVFGSESRGLPAELLDANKDAAFTIPMRRDKVRSLNLATAAGIVLYEALRQLSNSTT